MNVQGNACVYYGDPNWPLRGSVYFYRCHF